MGIAANELGQGGEKGGLGCQRAVVADEQAMEGENGAGAGWVVYPYLGKAGDGLVAAGDFINGRFHMPHRWIKRPQPKPSSRRRLTGMHLTGIEQNQPLGRRNIFGAAVGKRLDTPFN